MSDAAVSMPLPDAGRDARVEPLRRWEIAAGLCIGLLFLLPLLMYGPFEEEEVTFGIFPNQLHYQALLHGTWLYWLNDLGFGTPLPLGHRLDFHPVFGPFAALASLRVTLTAVWLFHVALMVIYFLRLAVVSGIRPPLRLVLLALYVFSVISVCYYYENDWVTSQIAWSFYPVVLFYLRQAVRGEATTNFWLATVRLGLLFGFWVINANPGYIMPLTAVLVVYAVVAAPLRRQVYVSLAMAGVLCVAIAAERLYYTATEMRRFPPTLELPRPVLTPIAYARAAAAPFVEVKPELRLPFVGVVLGIAALASILWLRRDRDAHVRALTAAFVAALVLSLTPRAVSQWFSPSGAWIFRDPLVLFAVLAGGIVLQRGLDSPATWRRAVVWVFIVVQAGQQALTLWPGYVEYRNHRGTLEFYRYQGHAVGLGRTLQEEGRTYGRRIYLSQRVHQQMRGALSDYGVHFPTDLVFLGLNPINGWFKTVSMDRIYPSMALMHGYIGGQSEVVGNAALLDVLGINVIVTTEEEGGAPSGLISRHRIPVETFRGPNTLLVLANADAWPKAVLMEEDVAALALPRREGCPHDGAMCREYAAFAAKRLPGDVRLREGDGTFTAQFPASDRARELFLSVTHRPEWEATSSDGAALHVDLVGGAFVGVRVPAGVDRVDLAFHPRAHVAVTWFSSIAFFSALAACCALLVRRMRSTAAWPQAAVA